MSQENVTKSAAEEIADAKAVLDKLTDEQRSDLFRLYCRNCGSTDPKCWCDYTSPLESDE